MRRAGWDVTVLRIIVFLFLVLVGAGAARAAAADPVPRIDPTPSCRGATRGGNAEVDLKNCLQEEQAAHDQLVKDWGNYSASDRASCAQLSTMGGEPSYVELLTCLEMAKAAREAPDALLATPERAPPTSKRRRP